MLQSIWSSGLRTPRSVLAAVSILLFALAILATFWSFDRRPADEGVFRIFVTQKNGVESSGSGFKVADPGYVVTNYHVVNNAKNIFIAFLKNKEIELVKAKIVWLNSDRDLAILKSADQLPFGNVTLASIGSEEVNKTERVTAIGFPGIADRLARGLRDGVVDDSEVVSSLLDPTVSVGAVQRLVPTIQRLTIQHSANINSGNSGGPLFDACKRVIGVNTLGSVSVIGASDILEAIREGGVQIENVGDLEFAVHIREVFAGLNEREIPFSSTPGQCRAGFDIYEIGFIGATALLAIGVGLMAGFAPFRKLEDGQSFGFFDDFEQFDEPGLDPSAKPTRLEGSFSGFEIERQSSGNVISRFEDSTHENGSGYVIGRSADQAEIVVSDNSVSRKHAIIRFHNGQFVIHDCGSTNGTSCDGKSVTQSQGSNLLDGALVKVGDATIVFRLISGNGNLGKTPFSGSFMLSGFDSGGRILQHRVDNSNPASSLGKTKNLVTIGRGRANSFIINDNTISRNHASIGVDSQGRLVVADLGSSNGTFVGSVKVGKKPVIVSLDQTIAFGDTRFTISKVN